MRDPGVTAGPGQDRGTWPTGWNAANSGCMEITEVSAVRLIRILGPAAQGMQRDCVSKVLPSTNAATSDVKLRCVCSHAFFAPGVLLLPSPTPYKPP